MQKEFIPRFQTTITIRTTKGKDPMFKAVNIGPVHP